MLLYLGRAEEDIVFCDRCLLPLPEGKYERYRFCPWCSKSPDGYPPKSVSPGRTWKVAAGSGLPLGSGM